MKIEIGLDKIRNLTTKAYKGVSNNRLAPVTSLMGLEFGPDGFVIRTFDGENHVVVKDRSFKTDEKSNITINAEIFKNLIDKVTTDKVGLEIKDRFLEVTANGTYRIEIVYDDDKVLTMKNVDNDLDKEGAVEVKVDRKVLQAALDYNEVSAAKTTEVLFETGAFMGKDIITTDEVLATITHKEFIPNNRFLFKYSTLHLIDIFDKDELTFKYCANGTVYDFALTDGNNLVRGVTMEGAADYPVKELTDLVMGGSTTIYCEVETAKILEILDRLSIFVTPYDNDRVDLSFTNSSLAISSKQSKAVEKIVPVSQYYDHDVLISLSLTPFKMQLSTIKDKTIKLYYGSEQSVRIGTAEADYLIATIQRGD